MLKKTALLLLALAVAATLAAAERKLVLHLAFEEETGEACRDSSGNAPAAFKATIVNPAQAKRVPGRFGKAVEFSAADIRKGPFAYVLAENFYDPSLQEAFTLEVWMRMADGADWMRGLMYLICCTNSNYAPGFSIYYNWRFLMFPNETTNKLRASVPDLRRQWVHVAATWDGATKTARLYKDGKLVAEQQGLEYDCRPKAKNPPLLIGVGPARTYRGFIGALDEVKIYNYPLTNQEILEHAKLEL